MKERKKERKKEKKRKKEKLELSVMYLLFLHQPLRILISEFNKEAPQRDTSKCGPIYRS